MKIKFSAIFIAVFIGLLAIPVGAQPAHTCGTIVSMSVAYDRDAAGFMPRMTEGSQDQFNCIAARDPFFNNQRFDAGWKALNYWFTLYGQELGVLLQPLPAPTN